MQISVKEDREMTLDGGLRVLARILAKEALRIQREQSKDGDLVPSDTQEEPDLLFDEDQRSSDDD